MPALRGVDEYAATAARALLADYRDEWQEMHLSRQRADHLEQAITEAIHEAANRPKPGNTGIPAAQS